MDERLSEVDSLILKIHAAPLESLGWHAVAKDLVKLCGAERAVMLRVGLTPAVKPWVLPLEFDPIAVAEYADHWGPHDLFYWGALRHGRIKTGVVSTEEQVMDRGEYLSSMFFNDFLRRLDVERQMNVCLAEPEQSLGVGPSAVALYRGVGKEPFGPAEAAVLKRLAPHLSIAARTTWRLDALQINDLIWRGALDTLSEAFFALGAQGRLVLTNRAGESHIRRSRWVTATDGRLAAAGDVIERTAFALALAKLESGIGNTLSLTNRATGKQVIVTTVPISRDTTINGMKGLIAGIVWLIAGEIEKSPAGRLAKLFEMTGAEERLLQRLVAGDSLREAANLLQVSIHTARNQLKAIFRKSGRRTQGQLLALASRMAMIQGDEDPSR